MLLIFCNVYSQSILDTTITIKIRNLTLENTLKEIEEDINRNFSYNPDLISIKRTIKQEYNNNVLKDILHDLIKDSTLAFKEIDKQIVIHKKNKIQNFNTYTSTESLDSIIVIKGNVYDAITGESLPFANLGIKDKSYGTISNENGKFKLKIPASCIDENIIVSYMGYRNAVILIKDLSLFDNSIYIEKDILKIQEAIIRLHNPTNLISKALEGFSKNYFYNPYEITGFYREYVNKKNSLMSISEAVIEIYKSPYGGFYSDQIKVLKSRQNVFYQSEDTIAFKLKGGLNSSLYLDIIKNPHYFLKEEYFNLFQYEMDNIVMFNGNASYVIKFIPKYYLEENSFEGKIYINSNDMAILAIKTNITKEALEKIGSSLVIKEARKTKVYPESVAYSINYRKIGNRYFLNQVRGELEFKVKQRNKLFGTNYKTVFELATNYIDTVGVKRFKHKDIISTNGIFIDEKYRYDSDFWGNYNYIIPNETLEDALIRINKNLDALKEEKN